MDNEEDEDESMDNEALEDETAETDVGDQSDESVGSKFEKKDKKVSSSPVPKIGNAAKAKAREKAAHVRNAA